MTLEAVFTTAKKMETTCVHQMIKKKQNVVYPHNEILFDNERENNADRHYHID